VPDRQNAARVWEAGCTVAIGNLHAGGNETRNVYHLPGCDAVQPDRSSMTFHRNVMPPSSWTKRQENTILPASCFLLIISWAYYSTLKMEALRFYWWGWTESLGI
jgi:hypothetical protein